MAARAKAKAPNLDALFEAWDRTTGDGRDEEAARRICDEYVATNPKDFEEFAEWTVEECVTAIDVLRLAAETFRANGLERQAMKADLDKLMVDVWLLHHFDPQQIGGFAEAKVRIPTNG